MNDEWKATLHNANGKEIKPPREPKEGHHWILITSPEGEEWQEEVDLKFSCKFKRNKEIKHAVTNATWTLDLRED